MAEKVGNGNSLIFGISIVVCCHNSENRLLDVLNHLDQLGTTDLNCEIIVVDNFSTDQTYQIAEHFFESSLIKGSVIIENILGLSYARKAGVANASYEVILFCDDDNYFEHDYLRCGLKHFLEKQELGCLGGLGIPQVSLTLPDWFSLFSSSYAVGSLGKKDGIQQKGTIHYGACLFFRTEALLKYYNRNIVSPITDRKAKSLASGGDSELCLGVQLEGYSLEFDSNLCFYHKIDSEKISEKFYIRLRKGILENYPILTAYEFFLNKKKSSYQWFLIQLLPSLFEGLFKTLIFLSIKRDFIHKVYFLNYLFKISGLFRNYHSAINLHDQLKEKYK